MKSVWRIFKEVTLKGPVPTVEGEEEEEEETAAAHQTLN